jgi:hypothetical protein
MCITTAQAGKHRNGETTESDDGIASECAEQQIEPDYVGLTTVQCTQQAEHAGWIVRRPATNDIESLQFVMLLRQFVSENRQTEKRIALQFLRDMESIFTQPSGTGRKRRNQTDFHGTPGAKQQKVRCAFRERCCSVLRTRRPF